MTSNSDPRIAFSATRAVCEDRQPLCAIISTAGDMRVAVHTIADR